jgi:hypothetical protein
MTETNKTNEPAQESTNKKAAESRAASADIAVGGKIAKVESDLAAHSRTGSGSRRRKLRAT